MDGSKGYEEDAMGAFNADDPDGSMILLHTGYRGQPDDRATRVGYVYYRQIAG